MLGKCNYGNGISRLPDLFKKTDGRLLLKVKSRTNASGKINEQGQLKGRLARFGYLGNGLRSTILFNQKILTSKIINRTSFGICYRNRQRYQISADPNDIGRHAASRNLRIEGLPDQSDYRTLTGAQTENACTNPCESPGSEKDVCYRSQFPALFATLFCSEKLSGLDGTEHAESFSAKRTGQ